MAELKVFVFGLTLAMAVGPVALLILSYGMSRGLRAGALAGLGAALADLSYALAAFFLGNRLAPLLASRSAAIRLMASLVLVGFGSWMVWSALRSRTRETAPAAEAEERPGLSGPLTTIYLLTIVNPLTILLFLGFSTQLPLAGSPWRVVGFAVLLFFGSLLGQMVFALGGAGLGRILMDRVWIARLNVLSGLVIAAFGLSGLRP